MEQNKEMTAQESLKLISETLNKTRQEVVRNGGKYFFMWGILLTVISLVVYFLVKQTGHHYWNFVWFAMPVIGLPLAHLLKKSEKTVAAENAISRMNAGIWGGFGIFACSVAVVSLLCARFGNDPVAAVLAMASITAHIAILFGMAMFICGINLNNWIIKVAGFVTGIGGVAVYYLAGQGIESLLIFTFAGIVLAATGLLVKYQYK